jgi:phage-related protein
MPPAYAIHPSKDAEHAEAIVVLHAFQKKTQKTPAHELAVRRQRLHEVLHGGI